MSSKNQTLQALGQLALDYHLAVQATKKAEARLDRAENALRKSPELGSSSSFNIYTRHLCRELVTCLKQLHEELQAAQLNERRCKAMLFKAAKEAA